MAFDDILDMAGEILPDTTELISTLTESQQKILSLALKLTLGSIKIYREHQDKKALATVGQNLNGQLPPELAEELREFCQQFQEDGAVIPPECRKRFLKSFLEKHPDFQYMPQLYNAFSVCVSQLEKAVRENYSVGELSIVRTVLAATQVVEDTNYIVRDSNQRLQDIQNRLYVIASPQPQTNQTSKLNTSNGKYAAMFTEALFLHRGRNDKVNLSNLFVPHKFNVEQNKRKQIKMVLSYKTIDDDIADFIRNGPQFLFIEGDAGCGKSALTQYLSYHHELQDEIAQRIFGDINLITIRLRDIQSIPTECQVSERLTRAILRFLYKTEDDKNNLERFQKSGRRLLWLDGYDELCTIKGMEDPQSFLRTLKSLDCEIVVTTRPNYIRFNKLLDDYWHIALRHFDIEQRKEWLTNYETKCGETLGDVNQKYLERIQNTGDAAGICDTPLGLYMVAAGHFTEEMLGNEWALYRQIFHEEIKNTSYNKAFGGFSWEHPSYMYWESLYRVSEEIAWYLYQRDNADLLVSNEEVDAIIEKLELPEDNEIIKRCFALCGYWNMETKQGYVEFYHNNIRDFFLCEKLMRELNRIYQEYGHLLRNEKNNILPFLECLCKLFQYGKLEERVLCFLRQRSAYSGNKEPDVCIEQITEPRNLNTAYIFEGLLFSGKPYSGCAKQLGEDNPICTIANILMNTISIYRYLFEPFLPKGECINWWRNSTQINQDRTFRLVSKEIFSLAGPSYFFAIDLHGATLSGADLNHANLHSTNLHCADLRGANLCEADLRNANLHGADLSGADLHGADLSGANLHATDLSSADLHGANLHGANLHGTDLSNTNLHGADLSNASLYGADLRGANLQSTDFSGAKITQCHIDVVIGIPPYDQ